MFGTVLYEGLCLLCCVGFFVLLIGATAWEAPAKEDKPDEGSEM